MPARGALLGVAFATACGLASLRAPEPAAADPPVTASPAPQAPPWADTVPVVREGSPIAISRHEERLYVASEELRSIRIVALPDSGPARVVAMPGPVANLVVLPDDRVLAAVRDPGLLVLLRPDAASGLVEAWRVPVSADAWGLALAPDGATAFVTSAWTHTVSAVDLAGRRVRWTLDVPREPRGIVAHGSGPLYVSHLTSGAVTRIDGAAGVPTARAVDLPLAPLRAPRRGTVEGSLGYALALSPDGLRLFAARHALGVVGEQAWFGSAALDVLLLPDDRPLAPARATSLLEAHPADTDASTYPRDPATDPVRGPFPMVTPAPFSQPRAVVYRRSTDTLLVAGEGDRAITELDALAPDPALAVVRIIPLGGEYNDPYGGCAAPSGIALSADDSTAYVFCRASFDVWSVTLSGAGTSDVAWTRSIGKDPLPWEAAAGRILFYTARRSGLSEGLACSGCHPEGRDDGHVWHEVDTAAVPEPKQVAGRIFVGGFGTLEIGGAPRQTPMLAGRVGSPGPYGWLGEDADLVARITHGASLHRWAPWSGQAWQRRDLKAAIARIARFLREGLPLPPSSSAPLTPLQVRGKEIFERRDVGCTSCHAGPDEPAIMAKLPKLPIREGFDDEDPPLKAPSLRFVGGTPPYLHDGSEPSLLQLLRDNRDRMGHTAMLTQDELAALAAYLETL